MEDGLLALDLVKGIDDTEKRRALEQAAKMLFGLKLTNMAANHIILYVI